jgi:AcrR family transcriptional regulator
MKRSARKKAGVSTRLSSDDWVDAALLTLGRRGVANVRVERLARDLKVTKGSFYWHFKDRDALLDAMLVRYRARAESTVREALASESGQPLLQIRRLLEAPQHSAESSEAPRMELAIRLWAKRSDHVKSMLHDIYLARDRFMERLLTESGVDVEHARPLSQLLHAVAFQLWTREDLGDDDRKALIDLTIDTIADSARRHRRRS